MLGKFLQKICVLQQLNDEEGGKAGKQAKYAMDCMNNKLYKFIVDQADKFTKYRNLFS